MKKFTVLGLLGIALLMLVSCSGASSGAGYQDITVSELENMLAEEEFTFVNVHIPFEGNIPQTDLVIPFNEIEANQDQLPADKSEKIVLYCRSGNMSQTAAEKLVDMGYSNVWNLEGGYIAWENAGNSMDSNP